MDGWITIGTKIENKNFDKQIAELEKNIQMAEKDLKLAIKYENTKAIERINIDLEKMKNKLISLKQQQKKVNNQGFNEAVKSSKILGRGIESNIRKIGRLTLGIFGLRSAYMAVRNASNTLGQYDKQYATNIEYIRYALAMGIAPILKGIVNLAMQLLKSLNYILNAWFGINLFANAGVKNFQKMKNASSSTAKNVKEIKKQLAGFDEMTILGDSNQDSLGGGIGEITVPDIDLSSIDGEVPSWLKWIKENKDIILSALAGIAMGIVAIKLGATGIQALGIGIMISGIVYIIKSLLDYLKNPGWENFGKIIQGIGGVIIGLGILIRECAINISGSNSINNWNNSQTLGSNKKFSSKWN